MLWKFRVKKHYLIKWLVNSFNKFIVHTFICHKELIEINKLPDNYDDYIYCRHETKEFCPIGQNKKKYSFNIKGAGYIFTGSTIEECYSLAVSSWFCKSPITFPKDKRWTKKSFENKR